MSNVRILIIALMMLVLWLLADMYNGIQEQKRQRQAAIEHEQREKQQQAHLQELEEENRRREELLAREKEQRRQREDLLEREQEQMRVQQEMMEQANEMGEKALRGAKLAQGLQMATMFKMAISTHYQTKGNLPGSNREVGLDHPESYASGALAAVQIRSGGVIALIYTAATGVENGEIYLLPTERTFGLDWSCVTPDYIGVNQLISSCVFEMGRY